MLATWEMLRQMVGINSWRLNPAGVESAGAVHGECFAPLGFIAEFVPSANPAFAITSC